MKKIFFIFILVSCLTAGFAETGYNGLNWKMKRELINFGTLADTWNYSEDLEIVSTTNVAMGDTTLQSFFFAKTELTGTSYFIQKKFLKDLLSKFDKQKKVLEIKTKLFTRNETQKEIEELKKQDKLPYFYNDYKSAFLFLMAEKQIYEISRNIERTGYKNIPKAKNKGPGIGTLYIYDYNNDTRVYIADNEEGIIFVAYVPHFKDY